MRPRRTGCAHPCLLHRPARILALSSLRDGEEELLDSWLAEEGPLQKLQLSVLVSALVAAPAYVISWLADVDPAGGGRGTSGGVCVMVVATMLGA